MKISPAKAWVCIFSSVKGGWAHRCSVTKPSQRANHVNLVNVVTWNINSFWSKQQEIYDFVDSEKVSRAKPVPSHTQANARTSPAVPTLKPSYSQVTRLGIRAHDPGKQHVTGARDRPRDLQVLWGSRDPRTRDPVKKTGDLPRDWSATRSGDYRYVMHLLNHPMGTTNGGVRINKVV